MFFARGRHRRPSALRSVFNLTFTLVSVIVFG